MSKKILFFAGFLLLCIPLFSLESRINVFLTNFFDEKEFSVEEYQYQNDKVCFAYYSKDNNDKIQKAIVFKIKDNSIEPLAFINNNKIFNSKEQMAAPTVYGKEFYGWKSTLKINNNNLYFSSYFYMNNGKNVADPPITLKLKNGVFETTSIPKSEL